jgi:uncharacterized OB-fold protein
VTETAAEWTRPVPAVDKSSSEFWLRCRQGRLSIQQCPVCGTRQFYPRLICGHCGAEPELIDVSGDGSVYTFTVVRHNGAPAFRDEVPYVLAMIELTEGPMMMGNVIECPSEDVTIGMQVKVEFVPVSEHVAMPMWRPADNSD